MSALFHRLTGLTLLDPGFLWLGLLVPLASLAAWWRARAAGPGVLFPPAGLWPRTPRSWRLRLLPLPPLLQALGLLLVVLALARPARSEHAAIDTEGLDILLCLDTSSSMTANDMDRERSRLAVARQAADAFIEQRPDDRIGLLAFSRYPEVRCPLTRDHVALRRILADVEAVASDSPLDATGLGAAVARAAQVLQGTAGPARIVILLTDGEENVALAGAPDEIAPVHAAQLCQRLGVRVYAIAAGVGRQDAAGAFVPLDTRALQQLAARTGGVFHAARDAAAAASVYAQIDALEKAPMREPRTVFTDRFLLFLLAGVGLLLLGRALGTSVLAVLP